MSDQPQGPGWWQAADGRWYPPDAVPGPEQAMSQGPYSHGPYAYGSVPAKQGTNGLAIASLVTAIVGLCFCPSAIAGIVMGHIALNQLKDPLNSQEGRGLAIGGLAVGYTAIGLTILFIFVTGAAGA